MFLQKQINRHHLRNELMKTMWCEKTPRARLSISVTVPGSKWTGLEESEPVPPAGAMRWCSCESEPASFTTHHSTRQRCLCQLHP